MRNWPYAWEELQQPGSAVAGRVGVTTMVAEAGQAPAATQGSWGLAVLADSRHPQQAVQVLQALTSADSQRQLLRRYGYTPTLRALFDDPELLAERPLLPVLRQALEVAALRPITPAYAQLSDILQRQLSAVITGERPAAAAMAEAGRASALLLRAGGETSRASTPPVAPAGAPR
jgi:multiple sugar transport system substrate-binding protein